MGWNDRLPDNPYEPTDEERQRYDAWCEYQEYLKWLDSQLEASTSAPAPENTGLSSQTIDPTCYETDAIDIFGHRKRYTPTTKDQQDGQDQEQGRQEQEDRQPNHQD